MNIRNEVLCSDTFYHVYNRGINGETLFKTEKNYLFFLSKLANYLNPICDIYAYCLMPNHFHLLLKVKSKEDMNIFYSEINNPKNYPNGLHADSNLVSKQMGKLISSYTQAYNKVYDRHGALLESPFKRKRIKSKAYLINSIIYIHLNPNDLKKDYETYKFSSYRSILSDAKTHLKREDVLDFFGDRSNFIFTHKHPPKFDFKF